MPCLPNDRVFYLYFKRLTANIVTILTKNNDTFYQAAARELFVCFSIYYRKQIEDIFVVVGYNNRDFCGNYSVYGGGFDGN